MGKYSAKGLLCKELRRCDRWTSEYSSYREDDLVWIQNACCAYCKKHHGKFTTEVTVNEDLATVTMEVRGINPMRDWDFLRSVVHQAWRIIPQYGMGAIRVCFEVKLFAE